MSPMTSEPVTLHLTVGLPGSGKTTLARDLAARTGALRLTPDEWMQPLFGVSDVDGKRDVLEGRLIWTGFQALRGGLSVILDFGCWSPEERWAIRDLAGLAGADFRLHHLWVDEEVRRARCDARWLEVPHETFPMSAADQERYVAACIPPSADELSYAPIPDPPAGHETWAAWAAWRWPSLPRLDLS